LFVTRQRDHNPSEYTNLYRNWEQQHVGSTGVVVHRFNGYLGLSDHRGVEPYLIIGKEFYRQTDLS